MRAYKFEAPDVKTRKKVFKNLYERYGSERYMC